MSTIGTSIRAQCIGILIWILRSILYQQTPFTVEFDFIEAKCGGVNERIHFRIQIQNLDEDVIQMLTILIRIAFAAELGNHIHKVCAIALLIRTHYHLVYGVLT